MPLRWFWDGGIILWNKKLIIYSHIKSLGNSAPYLNDWKKALPKYCPGLVNTTFSSMNHHVILAVISCNHHVILAIISCNQSSVIEMLCTLIFLPSLTQGWGQRCPWRRVCWILQSIVCPAKPHPRWPLLHPHYTSLTLVAASFHYRTSFSH